MNTAPARRDQIASVFQNRFGSIPSLWCQAPVDSFAASVRKAHFAATQIRPKPDAVEAAAGAALIADPALARPVLKPNRCQHSPIDLQMLMT